MISPIAGHTTVPSHTLTYNNKTDLLLLLLYLWGQIGCHSVL